MSIEKRRRAAGRVEETRETGIPRDLQGEIAGIGRGKSRTIQNLFFQFAFPAHLSFPLSVLFLSFFFFSKLIRQTSKKCGSRLRKREREKKKGKSISGKC
jgi:hypothetical protein